MRFKNANEHLICIENAFLKLKMNFTFRNILI